MENQNDHTDLINTFCEIASSSREEAQFFLESHNYDLDSAVSTYLETTATAAAEDNPALLPPVIESPSPAATPSPSSTPSRSRSPSPPASLRGTPNRYNLRSREPMASSNNPSKKPSGSRPGGIRTLSDLNRPARDGSGSDSDEPQEYYTGGEKSGMLVQDPTRSNDVDAIFRQAKQAGAVEGPPDHFRPSSSSRSFVGTGRLLSGETVSPAPAAAPQQPEVVTHNITFWSNGFTIDDGPLRRFDDPENAPFLESIKKSECPKELEPADRRTAVHVSLMRKEENCPVQVKPSVPFRGTGRTLGSSSSAEPAVDATASASTTTASPVLTAPQPFVGLVVDPALPSTSIQLRLADGTRMVSRFNFHHTVRDIRGFIDASRPGGARAYHLQTVGFPPKQLTDLDQTIEQAGLANSVVIQKL